MYKLFLTFRYLTRKKIVIFPILVVWLCVMMLIIVTSIMGGFVDRVRDANRDLYGDIVISAGSSSRGFAGYEELIAGMKAKFPEVAATTTVVEIYSLLYVPSRERSVPALLVGIKPEERSQVSKFRESLFQQYQSPMEAVEDLAPRLPASQPDLMAYADKLIQKSDASLREADEDFRQLLGPGYKPRAALGRGAWMLVVMGVTGILLWRARRQRNGWGYVTAGIIGVVGAGIVVLAVLWPVIFHRQFDLTEDRLQIAEMRLNRSWRTRDFALGLPSGTYKTRDELAKAMVPASPTFKPPAVVPKFDPDFPRVEMPTDGCIVGAQIGFFERDTRGNFIHYYPDRFPRVSITVFPPNDSGAISVKATNAATKDFTISDTSHSGVYDIDSLNVYADFNIVQTLAGMRADPAMVALSPQDNFAPRCHQILIRLNAAGQSHMRDVRAQINTYVQEFLNNYRGDPSDARPAALRVQTWDEKQAKYLGAVQNEKTMMTFILFLMSGVVLVVIFLIFYQIVRDKTRDIGIIKAVGGSELGVAGIFLSYGLLIGVVGGGLGALSGTLFVTHTNEIHEWIFQTTGMIIWDRSVYLFDRIPDVVRSSDIVLYFSIALVAGVLGSLVPAILAALEDPVKAVRYE